MALTDANLFECLFIPGHFNTTVWRFALFVGHIIKVARRRKRKQLLSSVVEYEFLRITVD